MGKISISAFGVVLFNATYKISFKVEKSKNNFGFPKISLEELIVIMYYE